MNKLNKLQLMLISMLASHETLAIVSHANDHILTKLELLIFITPDRLRGCFAKGMPNN